MCYSELAGLTYKTFTLRNGPAVALEVAYTKNGRIIPRYLASDLAAFLATISPCVPAFLLPLEKGAKPILNDPATVRIPYKNTSGRYIDVSDKSLRSPVFDIKSLVNKRL